MGAKTCVVAQSEGDVRRILAVCPNVQESATTSLVASLFPSVRFGPPRATDLSQTYLSDKSVVAGCFPDLRIVIAAEVAVDRPSELPSRFIANEGDHHPSCDAQRCRLARLCCLERRCLDSVRLASRRTMA